MTNGQHLRAAFRQGDAVSRMAHAEVAHSRVAGLPVGEVEGLDGPALVALCEEGPGQATCLARRADERRPEERPRRVLAAVARRSGDHTRECNLSEAGIELDRALGQDERECSEYHDVALAESYPGTVERTHRLITGIRERDSRAGCRDLLPCLGPAGACLASAEGAARPAAPPLGFPDQALAVLGQVPGPGDAREPDSVRARVPAVLRRDAFESEYATGAARAFVEHSAAHDPATRVATGNGE